MTPFEEFVLQRLVDQTAVLRTPAVESALLLLLRGAKEGHLCSEFTEALPPELCGDGTDPKKPLVRQGTKLYFQKNWALESQILEKVIALWNRPTPVFDSQRWEHALASESPHLNAAQLNAVTQGFSKSLTLFSGGPGTGKTYTAAAFIRLLAASQPRCKVIISAPTGKAAAHLESVLQRTQVPNMQWESMTLHRLLKLRPRTQNLLSKETLDADLIVVDEASMMDGSLLLHLLNAVGPTTRLLLLGDADQLPPVEGISFFPEMAKKLGQKLTQSVRMGEGMVAKTAQAILEGKPESVERLPWISEPNLLVDWLCTLLPSPHHAAEPDPLALLLNLSRFRILCALRQGPFGVDSLNQQILARFQSQNRSSWLSIPILILQNSPQQNLFNGTPGILVRRGGVGVAYFLDQGGVRKMDEKALPLYETAFCLSIHKSQGSEFDEVLIVLGPGSERFGKEALYTGVTRAKSKVQICAEDGAFLAALQRRGTFNSGFAERLDAENL